MLLPYAQIESEGANDFRREVNDSQPLVQHRPQRHIAHDSFLAGPKFQFGGSGPFHVFLTAKGGLVNFSGTRTLSRRSAIFPVAIRMACFIRQEDWSSSRAGWERALRPVMRSTSITDANQQSARHGGSGDSLLNCQGYGSRWARAGFPAEAPAYSCVPDELIACRPPVDAMRWLERRVRRSVRFPRAESVRDA